MVKSVTVTSKKWEWIKSKDKYGFVSRKVNKHFCRIKRFGPADSDIPIYERGTGVQCEGGNVGRDNNGVMVYTL